MGPKPIVIEKKGRKWFVFVKGTPIVKHEGKLNFDRAAAGLPGDSLPLLEPHGFSSKADAEDVAHKIGRYVLQLGDFVHSYTEIRK
jgi:hypothetical protein